MFSILSSKINKNLIGIIGDYLMIPKEEVKKRQKILFDKPIEFQKIYGYSSIKSQALQFRLRKYTTYLDTFYNVMNKDISVINCMSLRKDYDLLFINDNDLLSYISDINLAEQVNRDKFYIFLFIRNVDVLKCYKNYNDTNEDEELY